MAQQKETHELDATTEAKSGSSAENKVLVLIVIIKGILYNESVIGDKRETRKSTYLERLWRIRLSRILIQRNMRSGCCGPSNRVAILAVCCNICWY